jgi:tripartite-type tricarboxylate transporter receptor subunit TctC
MFKCRSCLSFLFSAVALVALGMSAASGQIYPGKPIRIIAPGIGSSYDISARLIVQVIAGSLGQPVIVENPPVGVISGQMVSQSAPDGYTLLYTASPLWLGPFMRDSTPYDAVRDFQPITETTRSPGVLVVHPNLPVKSARELIALAKARPGALNYGSGSTGSIGHLGPELFQSMAGIKLVRIAYRSGAQAVTDLIAGEVQMMISTPASVISHVKSGRLKALGVTSAQPTSLVPGIPTVTSTGLPGYEAGTIAGMFAPARTPRAIVNRLNQEIVRAIFSAELKEKFLALGLEPVGGSPEQMESSVKAEMATMGKLIKDLGIRE